MGKAHLHRHDFCGDPDLKPGKLYHGWTASALFHRNRAADAVSADEKKMVRPESDCPGCGAWRGLLWDASPSLKAGRFIVSPKNFLLFLIFVVILTNCKNPVTEY